MKVVEEEASRVIDTFAARNLHELQNQFTIDSYIDYGIHAGYSLSSAQERREKEVEA